MYVPYNNSVGLGGLPEAADIISTKNRNGRVANLRDSLIDGFIIHFWTHVIAKLELCICVMMSA